MVVVAGVGWGLFVHDPAPAEPNRPAFLSPPGEPLEPPTDNESYRLTARFQSTDPSVNDMVVRQREYVPGRQPVVKDSQVASDGEIVQSVTYRTGSRKYTRETFDDARSFRRSLDGERVAAADRTSLTAYELDAAEAPPASIEPKQALEKLYLLGYEKAGQTTVDGETVDRYVPVSGWTTTAREDGSGHRTLYVRRAEGEVLVDPEDGAILRSEVSASIIEADTWADVMTGNAYSISVEYEVDTGIEEVRRPPWVRTLNESRDTGVRRT